uniref:Uncharacterized protein n=1 Tax=Rhizophora mucronata TaxID=61149 RepID=A0A2P2NMC3_RHIMU
MALITIAVYNLFLSLIFLHHYKR